MNINKQYCEYDGIMKANLWNDFHWHIGDLIHCRENICTIIIIIIINSSLQNNRLEKVKLDRLSEYFIFVHEQNFNARELKNWQ